MSRSPKRRCRRHPRIHGELGRFELPPLSEEDVLGLAREVLGSDEKLNRFVVAKDGDAAVAVPGLGRFRANLFYQRDKPGMVLRTIGSKILSVEALDLPEVVKTIASANEGLVLVTGATGSGKSTTLAAMVDHINDTEACHIMTLEDPIEFVHPRVSCTVNQRELGIDTQSIPRALKSVLSEDPNVILVGEMRDLETIAAALIPAQKEAIAAGQGFLTPALREPRERLVRNLEEEEPFKSCARLGFETASLLLAPILIDSQVLGLIVLGGQQSCQFDLNELNLARGVARQAAQAILNARYREEDKARTRHAKQFVRF